MDIPLEIAKKNIPSGPYCYDENGKCPYWLKVPKHGSQNDGYCKYLKIGDWEVHDRLSLLWDAVKECGINDDDWKEEIQAKANQRKQENKGISDDYRN